MSEHHRDLAEAIHHEIISPESVKHMLDHCARHFEALAVAIRDHGPQTAEGVLTAMAGAHFGALMEAAAVIRAGQWGDYEEEDGYPGSLLPKRGTP